MITLQKFRQMIPTNKEPDAWYAIAMRFFEKYQINTQNRIAGFMAQCAHESNDFRALEENLNYSEDALNRVFGRYFGAGKRNAAEYARNPQKIANYVYMDEFRSKKGALGNTVAGDGWRFRGGGIKQLTGRSNFTVFANFMKMSPEQAADYVRTKEGAFESACWFWETNNISGFADRDDIDGMSRRINGGDIGIDDRRRRYISAKSIIGNVDTKSAIGAATSTSSDITLKIGSNSNLVKEVQTALKLNADGAFGPLTESAVKSWQRINRFIANGVIDQKQINKLLRRN